MPVAKRILLPDTNQGLEHVLKGISVADHLSTTLNVPDVIFLVPVKASLTSGSLHNALGKAVHDALAKGKPVKLPSGAHMRCETIQTLQWLPKPSVVIAVYASQKMMDKIDALQNVAAIVAIPWVAGEIDDWAKTWSPQILGQSSPPAQSAAKLITDPVVEQAMKSLTNIINKAHNSLHPSDEEHAKRILRILRSREHLEPAENIRRWAIKNGWLPKAAERLEVLAQKAFALRTKPKLENPQHAEQSYQRWADAAQP
ncbi:hypothetical protein [Pseudomonas sp. CBZ-4]|uniref:hypothetical protein n=1 Tax=Pseudomonas sp. CBZ-4 TaxID=1163065 RepID=UPI0003448DD6|nr:hypothetical protein [Pseudomonas sp. CBZ-4]